MNATQNIQRIIAAVVLTASAGLALASCAGQGQPAEQGSARLSAEQLAEQRTEYRDLAERRAEASDDPAPAPTPGYRDQAERRVGAGEPAPGEQYPDLAERRLRMTGH
jgi:hypothetical protein